MKFPERPTFMLSAMLPEAFFWLTLLPNRGLWQRRTRLEWIGRWETDGLIKVVASRETDEILGVHIIGAEASTLISAVCPFLRSKTRDFSQLIQAHPTFPEALKEAALDVDGMAIHLPKPLRVHKR